MNWKNKARIGIAALVVTALSACETTSSRQYSASTANVIAIQTMAQAKGLKVALGSFTEAEDAGSLVCRLQGPVDVASGKTRAEYIREALQTELFMAQAYEVGSPVTISGVLDKAEFSSMSPASWSLTMSVSSNVHPGYSVSVEHPFKTSFSAISACQNVAEAWAPAVQTLINAIVSHPEFPKVAGAKG